MSTSATMSMQDHLRDVGGFMHLAKKQGHHVDTSFGEQGWVRGSLVADSKSSTTFLQTISAFDVMQGSTGNDCWFVASASLLATEPSRVKALFLPACDPALGFYAIKLFSGGEWRVVWIDDRIPAEVVSTSDTGSAYAFQYSHSRAQEETWVWLLEKALAKLYGGYDNLDGGNIGEALLDLTGCPVTDVNLDSETARAKIKTGQLWKELQTNINGGKLCGCASFWSEATRGPKPDAATHGGVVFNHAYSVLGAYEQRVGKATRATKLLQIRNPWGHGVVFPKGAHSDGSGFWTPVAAKTFGYEAGVPGVFWMSFQEFLRHFNRLHFTETVQSLKGITYPQIGLTVISPTRTTQSNQGQAAAGADARDLSARMQYRKGKQPASVGATVVGAGDVAPSSVLMPISLVKGCYSPVAKTAYWNKRDVAIAFTATGGPMVVVPAIYEAGLAGSFTLIAQCSFQQQAYSTVKPVVKVAPFSPAGIEGWNWLQPWAASWSRSGKTAGGQMSNDTFAQNPQRVLTIAPPPAGGSRGGAPGGAATVHFLLTRKGGGKGKGYATAAHLLQLSHKLVGPVNKRLVVGAAVFTDQLEHVRTEQLAPGTYLLIPSMFKRGSESEFSLTVIADTQVTLSPAQKAPTRSRGNSLTSMPEGLDPHGLGATTSIAKIESSASKSTSPDPKTLFVGKSPGTSRTERAAGRALERRSIAVLPPIDTGRMSPGPDPLVAGVVGAGSGGGGRGKKPRRRKAGAGGVGGAVAGAGAVKRKRGRAPKKGGVHSAGMGGLMITPTKSLETDMMTKAHITTKSMANMFANLE